MVNLNADSWQLVAEFMGGYQTLYHIKTLGSRGFKNWTNDALWRYFFGLYFPQVDLEQISKGSENEPISLYYAFLNVANQFYENLIHAEEISPHLIGKEAHFADHVFMSRIRKNRNMLIFNSSLLNVVAVNTQAFHTFFELRKESTPSLPSLLLPSLSFVQDTLSDNPHADRLSNHINTYILSNQIFFGSKYDSLNEKIQALSNLKGSIAYRRFALNENSLNFLITFFEDVLQHTCFSTRFKKMKDLMLSVSDHFSIINASLPFPLLLSKSILLVEKVIFKKHLKPKLMEALEIILSKPDPLTFDDKDIKILLDIINPSFMRLLSQHSSLSPALIRFMINAFQNSHSLIQFKNATRRAVLNKQLQEYYVAAYRGLLNFKKSCSTYASLFLQKDDMGRNFIHTISNEQSFRLLVNEFSLPLFTKVFLTLIDNLGQTFFFSQAINNPDLIIDYFKMVVDYQPQDTQEPRFLRMLWDILLTRDLSGKTFIYYLNGDRLEQVGEFLFKLAEEEIFFRDQLLKLFGNQDNEGNTFIHHSINNANLFISAWKLLKKVSGFDYNFEFIKAPNSYSTAIKPLRYFDIELLIKQNQLGQTYLHRCDTKEVLEVCVFYLKTLLSEERFELLKIKDKEGNTILHSLVNDFDLLKEILSSCKGFTTALLNISDGKDRNLLQRAVETGENACVYYLLSFYSEEELGNIVRNGIIKKERTSSILEGDSMLISKMPCASIELIIQFSSLEEKNELLEQHGVALFLKSIREQNHSIFNFTLDYLLTKNFYELITANSSHEDQSIFSALRDNESVHLTVSAQKF